MYSFMKQTHHLLANLVLTHLLANSQPNVILVELVVAVIVVAVVVVVVF